MANWNIQIKGLDTLSDSEYQILRESMKSFVSVSHRYQHAYSDEYVATRIAKTDLFRDIARKDYATVILDNPTAQSDCFRFLEGRFPSLTFYDEEDNGPSFHGDVHGPLSPHAQVTNYRNRPFLHSVHNPQ